MGLIFMLSGVLIGVIFFRYIIPPRNQILYCRERDGRGEELTVGKEDGLSLETQTKPPYRFYKYGRAYEFLGRMGRAFTRFFGKEGTAYTWRLEGFDKDGNGNPKSKDLEFPTLEDAVKFRWGDEFYNAVPDEQKEELRNDKLLVTVNLEPGVTPEGYEPITEHTIKRKANEDMASLLSQGFKEVGKSPITQWIFILGCGIGVGWIIHSIVM